MTDAAISIRDFEGVAPDEFSTFLESLTPEERALKLYEWSFWARRDQMLPPGDWLYWLPLAGRGWGKTRVGAETVRQWIKDGYKYVNLIGATESDVEKVMIRGESGILSVCPPEERPVYIANRHELRWPNGARSLVFSAEKADRLRGNQHEKLWCDELAAWRYTDAWDQAMLGLRLGDKPQVVITTTPRPTKLIKDLRSDERTHFTSGSTYENEANLAEAFVRQVIKKYEGTRLGRQELGAEILDDMPGALFARVNIDKNRLERRPETMDRIVIAIDPAVTSGENADETGIIACGMVGGPRGHGYILDDVSGIYAPGEWSKEALKLYHKWRRAGCDCIVAETNQGGDMVVDTIRHYNPNVLVKRVHASKGKVTRAEPVSALYEQDRIHHVGNFGKLEDQMCVFTSDFDPKTAKYSPDRLDAMVWGFTELFGLQNDGMIWFMKDQLEQARAGAAPVKVDPAGFKRLVCPKDVSTAYGRKGEKYTADADGTMLVAPDDAVALIAAGFTPIVNP